MKEKKDRTKEFDDAVRTLLKTTEELKSKLPPLIVGQKDIRKIVKSHGKAINSIMDGLMGTIEEHEKTLKNLDLLQTRVSKIEKIPQESNKELIVVLKKRLEQLEFKQATKILKKMSSGKKLSTSDLETINELVRIHPNDVYLLSLKAEVLDGIGQKGKALEFLDESISKHPNGARLWMVNGKLLDDVDESLKSFKRSLDLLKDGPSANKHIVLHNRTITLASDRRFDEALESANEAIENKSDCYSIWILKGKILTSLVRIPEALGCFDKATDLDETRKEGWFNKGNALTTLGKKHYDDALESYNKAIYLDSEFAFAYLNKAKLLVMMDNDEEAIKIIDSRMDLYDEEACAWCDRGTILNRLGRNPEALESIEKALTLAPPKECYQIFQNFGIILYHLKKYERGVEIFEEYRKNEPKNVIFWNLLGCFLQKLNRDEAALHSFETALELRESDADIDWDDLAELYKRMGMNEKAEKANKMFNNLRKKASTEK